MDAIVIDLRGGDDRVFLSEQNGIAGRVTVSGGIGNDLIRIESLDDRVLKGDDGDDELYAPGRAFANGPVTYDGGAGRDLAGLGGVQPFTGGNEVGATASLDTGRVSYSGLNQAFQPVVLRNDTLAGIERLAGSSAGDLLTGGESNDELSGLGGPDNINGGGGADSVDGGDGLDDLQGGKGFDTVTGGTGIDVFQQGDGGDTYLARDGFLEVISCVKQDVIVDDLVDTVKDPSNCQSISTAQAKDRYDTHIAKRGLIVTKDGMVRASLKCPAKRKGLCSGSLEALAGRNVLAVIRYRLRPGSSRHAFLQLSRGEAARVRGQGATLKASEVDPDGRARTVLRRLR